MKKTIKKVINLSFEEKTVLLSIISVCFNFIFGVGKIIMSFFFGVFFLASGIVNILLGFAKLTCYIGIKRKDLSFTKAKTIVSILIFIAGIEYTIYMLRYVFWGYTISPYQANIAIIIASVSFTEMILAIIGLFKSLYVSHYYRFIKIINFISALSAIMLTMVALLSFASTNSNELLCGLSGALCGIIIMLLAVYIYFSEKLTIIGKECNHYKIKNKMHNEINTETIEIILSDNFWFGGYRYIGKVRDGVVEGEIIRTRWKFNSLNIYIKILLIILSEILVFVYFIGRCIFLIKNIKMINKLDTLMLERGYEKIKA